MARRRTSQAITVRTVPVRAPAPIIRVAAPRSAPTRKKHHRRRGGGRKAFTQSAIIEYAIGGAVFGFIEKSFPTMPTLPLIGRAGTVALVAYMMGAKGLMGDVGRAAAVIAGYELGSKGSISGAGGVPSQTAGVAAQV